MIDTIKLGIPLTKHQHAKLLKLILNDGSWQWVQYKRDTGDIRFMRVKGLFDFSSSKEKTIPSHSRDISWDMPDHYIPDETYLTFEFSVPKFWYGHNIHLLYNFLPALQEFKKTIEKMYHLRLKDVTDWQIWRLDICYAWRCPSQMVAQQILDSMKHLHYPRKKPLITGTSITFKGRTYTVKFYLKLPEFRANDMKKLLKQGKRLEWINHLESLADGVLRYEATIRRQYLRTNGVRTVGDILKTGFNYEWSEDFFELNDVTSEDKQTITIYVFYLFTYKYISQGVDMESVLDGTANIPETPLKDGDTYEAPPSTITYLGKEYKYNGGKLTLRKHSFIFEKLQYFLDRFLGDNRNMQEADEIKAKLYSVYKPAKAFRLYAIWLAVNRDGTHRVKEDLGNDSFYRVRRDLKKAGCSFTEKPITTSLDDEFMRDFKIDTPSNYVTNKEDDFRDSHNIINLSAYRLLKYGKVKLDDDSESC